MPDPNTPRPGPAAPCAWRARLWLVGLGGFWLTMMLWLWHAEYGRRGSGGSPVPVAMVWEKILTAPDGSSLQVSHRGTNVGFCRWSASVGRDLSSRLVAEEVGTPEGLIEKPTGYSLDLDGNVSLRELGTRVGYELTLRLGPGQRWEYFQARIRLRPDEYQVEAVAADQVVRIQGVAGGVPVRRQVRFSELRNPQGLLREMGGPILPALLASAGLPLSTNAAARVSLGMKWRARQDWLMAGRTRMRVYRLETLLLDRYRIEVCVSPVGEILRVDAPGEIRLQHETLNNLPPTS